MVKLYSNHCPACDILKLKLDAKKIDYELVDDINILTERGFDPLPVLEVDGEVLSLLKANEFISNYQG